MKKMIVPFILAVLIVGGVVFYATSNSGKKEDNKSSDTVSSIVKKDELKIVNRNSNSRSIAVMINNHNIARKNHSGLQDAYIVYEIIVEGGITRLLAIYKDKTLERVGSVRSSRHYFLDYALENDAVYIHWGGSPEAYSDIKTLGINNVDGIASSKVFFRDKTLDVPLEHTGFLNMTNLKDIFNSKKYRTTSSAGLLLNYSVPSVEMQDAKDANEIVIRYSNYITDKYVYDSEAKVYKRFVNNEAHTDGVTKKQYTFKNIIAYAIKNKNIVGGRKGRQEIENIGSGTGVYCSEGKCVDINYKKTSRSAKTVYTLKNGEELKVNDGNTFIQIYPTSGSITVK